MKKFMSLAVALVAAVVVSSSAFAANKTTPYVARAIFAGEASFSFTLKNISGTGTPTMIEWTSQSAFNMGEDVAWVKADQYAEVMANITKANANVYMYTNNKVDSGITNLQPSTWKDQQQVSHDSYGGLVRTAGQGATVGGEYRGYVPVYFTYSKNQNADITFDGTQRWDKTNWIFDRPLADISNDGYVEADNTIASLNGPTFGVDAETGPYSADGLTNNTAYMYFFGGFKQIIGGDTYQTKIYVKEVLE